MQKHEEEIARLKGHQNPQQKLQHLLLIKKENNALKEVSKWNTTSKLTICVEHPLGVVNTEIKKKYIFIVMILISWFFFHISK